MEKPPVQFFCIRPDGSITPLVPVDELPAYISIRGVPANLMVSETHGMTSLGTLNPRREPFIVDTDNVAHMGYPSNAMSANGDDVTLRTSPRMGSQHQVAQLGPEAWNAFAAVGAAGEAGAIDIFRGSPIPPIPPVAPAASDRPGHSTRPVATAAPVSLCSPRYKSVTKSSSEPWQRQEKVLHVLDAQWRM